MRTLPVKAITAENFSQFGSLIFTEGVRPTGGDANYDWYDKLGSIKVEGAVSVNIMHLRPRPFTLTKIEYHLRSPEAVFPLGKPFIITVAPGGKLQEDAIEAFYIPADRGVCMNAGIRHFMPFPLYENTDCVIIFRDGSGVDDLTFEDIKDPYALVLYDRFEV